MFRATKGLCYLAFEFAVAARDSVSGRRRQRWALEAIRFALATCLERPDDLTCLGCSALADLPYTRR